MPTWTPFGEIVFTVTGTIGLTSQLLIDKDMTITGPGANDLTISGGCAGRVFEITLGTVAIISGVTISQGCAPDGGGILNGGDLTLNDVVVSSNTATNNGGGILNRAPSQVDLIDSTVDFNTATNGGGIANEGGFDIAGSPGSPGY